MTLTLRRPLAGALIAALGLLLASCSSSSSTSGASSSNSASGSGALAQIPTANLPVPTSVGAGEGQLNLIAWEGYTQPQWVKPFTAETGCKVNVKYAGTSDEMVALMANGGGGQWDMVSSSGDADLRLIYSGDLRPVNVALVPSWKQLIPQLQAPEFNTIDGVHFGVSLQWGPNVLLYNTKKFASAPTSWSVIYNPAYKGQITIPDNPIQIADAALYLSKTQPSLGITDPYELTQPQFQAAIKLLVAQKPLVRKYWGAASDEISAFQNGDATVGAAWPYQTSTLLAAKAPVADTIPAEGATGWADTWMMAAKAPHPNCAYKWLAYITTPKVQAEQAVYYGETPANALACAYMNKLQAGSCEQYHANSPASYFDSIKFWKTPLANCGNGQMDCVPYSQWQQAWTTQVRG
jgi:putative spermidine/putrescine transport system substrate-binding protein